MEKKVLRLEIDFPVPVEIDRRDMVALDRIARRICDRYVAANPERMMWPFGSGAKITENPLKLENNEPIPRDDTVYAVECAEREAHDSEKDGSHPPKKKFTWYDPQEMFQDIMEFHEKFGLAYSGPPRGLPADIAEFRVKFLTEELAEYISSDGPDRKEFIEYAIHVLLNNGVEPPLEEQFDALLDLVYVALGTAYLQGFAFDEGWRRVHEANMKKVRALKKGDSKRDSTYDVVKPSGWKAPDLSDLVKE